MLWELFWVAWLPVLVGAVLLYLGIGDKESTDTEFGKFGGSVGPVLIALGFAKA